MSETTPLVGNNGGSGNGNAFYFHSSDKGEAEVKQYQSVADADGGRVVEQIPSGAALQDFEPRAIGAVPKVRKRFNVNNNSASRAKC
jgi:hypothetical protein